MSKLGNDISNSSTFSSRSLGPRSSSGGGSSISSSATWGLEHLSSTRGHISPPATSASTLALTACEMAESGCELSDDFVRLTVHDAIRAQQETDGLTPSDVARCVSLYGRVGTHLVNEVQRGMHVALTRRLELQVLRVGLDLQAEDVVMIVQGLVHANVSPTNIDVLKRLASAVRKVIKHPELTTPFSLSEAGHLLMGMLQLGNRSQNLYRQLFRHIASRLQPGPPPTDRQVLRFAQLPLRHQNTFSARDIAAIPTILSAHESFRHSDATPPIWHPELIPLAAATLASHAALLSDASLQALSQHLPLHACDQLAAKRLEAEAVGMLASMRRHQATSEQVVSLLQACSDHEAASLARVAADSTFPVSAGSSPTLPAVQASQPNNATSDVDGTQPPASLASEQQRRLPVTVSVVGQAVHQSSVFPTGSPVRALLVELIAALPHPSTSFQHRRQKYPPNAAAAHVDTNPAHSERRLEHTSSHSSRVSGARTGFCRDTSHADPRPDRWSSARSTAPGTGDVPGLRLTTAHIVRLVSLAPSLTQAGGRAAQALEHLSMAVEQLLHRCNFQALTSLTLGFAKLKDLLPPRARAPIATNSPVGKRSSPIGVLLPQHMTSILTHTQGYTPPLFLLGEAMQAIASLQVPQQQATALAEAVAAVSAPLLSADTHDGACAACLIGFAGLDARPPPQLLQRLCQALLPHTSAPDSAAGVGSTGVEQPPFLLGPSLAARTLAAVVKLDCASDALLDHLTACLVQPHEPASTLWQESPLTPDELVSILMYLQASGQRHITLVQRCSGLATSWASLLTARQLAEVAVSLSQTGVLTHKQLSVFVDAMAIQFQHNTDRRNKKAVPPKLAATLLSTCAQLGYHNPALLLSLAQLAVCRSRMSIDAAPVVTFARQPRVSAATDSSSTGPDQGPFSSVEVTSSSDDSDSDGGEGVDVGVVAGSGGGGSSSSAAWAGLPAGLMVGVVRDLVQLSFPHLPTYKQLAELLAARMDWLSLPQKASLLCSFLAASRLAATAAPALGPSQPGSAFAFSPPGSGRSSDREASGPDPHGVAMRVGPGGTGEAHTEHVLAVDLQPALEALFSEVIAGGLDLYHLTVEEIAAVLQDLAASGIYDEVLVRSACAASAYRLADSSSAALVKLTAAMASFKHPDVSYIDELAKAIQARAETLDSGHLLQLVPLFGSLPVSRQRLLFQSLSLAAVARVPAMPAAQLVALLEAFGAAPYRHGTLYTAVAHLVTNHPGRFLPGQLLAIGQCYYSAGQHAPTLFSVLASRMRLSAPVYAPRQLQEASTLLRALGMHADAAHMAQAFVTRVQANTPPHDTTHSQRA
ncbi:MAG: hypothetical protein WDW36_007910 [Sanguina aurantia]